MLIESDVGLVLSDKLVNLNKDTSLAMKNGFSKKYIDFVNRSCFCANKKQIDKLIN